MNRPLVALSLTFAALAIAGGCSSKKTPGGPGAKCENQNDCESGLCLFDATTNEGFCSARCHRPGDCGDFVDGCCQPADAVSSPICAPRNLCPQGDAGLGSPCPNHTECAPGLICLATQDNSMTECSLACTAQSDCAAAGECCEDLSVDPAHPQTFCVKSTACFSTDAGHGDDGGPFYAAFVVDGGLAGDTNSAQSVVGSGSDQILAPPTERNLVIQLPVALQAGSYGCSDGGQFNAPDAGLVAIVNTSVSSTGFADGLPTAWKNLSVPFACGSGVVTGGPQLEVETAQLNITQFTPGSVKTADAGGQNGHVKGDAYWRVWAGDGGSQGVLEVRSRFDMDLVAP